MKKIIKILLALAAVDSAHGVEANLNNTALTKEVATANDPAIRKNFMTTEDAENFVTNAIQKIKKSESQLERMTQSGASIPSENVIDKALSNVQMEKIIPDEYTVPTNKSFTNKQEIKSSAEELIGDIINFLDKVKCDDNVLDFLIKKMEQEGPLYLTLKIPNLITLSKGKDLSKLQSRINEMNKKGLNHFCAKVFRKRSTIGNIVSFVVDPGNDDEARKKIMETINAKVKGNFDENKSFHYLLEALKQLAPRHRQVLVNLPLKLDHARKENDCTLLSFGTTSNVVPEVRRQFCNDTLRQKIGKIHLYSPKSYRSYNNPKKDRHPREGTFVSVVDRRNNLKIDFYNECDVDPV
jgi:polyhydroxyalkanoate synthesis regulator phasin